MDFFEAIRTVFTKYATFAGRARRAEYWWWMLFTLLGGISFAILDIAMFDTGLENFSPLNTIFSLLTFIPTIAVTARRLHDINRTGWWQIFPIALFAVFIPMTLIGAEILAVAAVLAAAVAMLAICVFMFLRGTNGTNDYGPDPIMEYRVA